MDSKNYNIVFIADKKSKNSTIKISTNNLEKTETSYYNSVYSALSKICNKLYIYHSPKSFIKNIEKHKDDIVLSLWSGENSRSRKGLVPAICEAYNIKYVGSDCYVQILSQDKALAKEYCKKFGVNTPEYIIVNRNVNNINIKKLKLPLVIKPLDEGGSIGISAKNLVYSYENAYMLVKKLLKFYEVVMIEEYIDGNELCVVLFGDSKKIKIKGASMLTVDGETYMHNFIWGYEYKKSKVMDKIISSTDAGYLLTKEDWAKFEEIYFSLGKVELIRIDGRINENGFNLIELSPDPHIGPGASVAEVFKYNKIDYDDMIKMIIDNALQAGVDQNAKTLIG